MILKYQIEYLKQSRKFNALKLTRNLILLVIIASSGYSFSQNITENFDDIIDSVFLDTFHCGKYNFSSKIISKSEFEKAKLNSKTKYYPQKHTPIIIEGKHKSVNRINKDSILVKLNDGSLKWMSTNPGGDRGHSYKAYIFIEFIDYTNQFLFLVSSFEDRKYYLLDNQSSDHEGLSLRNTFSIDTSFNIAITTTYDSFGLMAGGFRLYKIDNNKLVLLCELEEIDSYTEEYFWAITEAYWINENEFVYIQDFENRKTSKSRKWYVKMRIEDR